MNKVKYSLILLFAFGILVNTVAQDKSPKKKKKKGTSPAAAPMPEKPADTKATIASKTKNCKKLNGIFTLYQDSTNGKLYLLVKKSQLGEEFIHFTYTENGVVDAGHFRGQFRGSRIFKINKVFDNLEFEQQNTSFYFDPKNALSKSSDANISHSILAFEKIIGFNEKDGEYLIDADELFLGEKLHPVKNGSFPGNPFAFNLGMLSRSKTRYMKIKNYPENADFVVKYVFDNPSPLNTGGDEVTDARSVAISLQHSIIKVPKNNFKPRFDDYRVGFFSENCNDMTTHNAVNYRDFIHRWNLEKKDPSAVISEPIKPIVWWIENTTPVEYRETIRQAAMQWNKAFEPLGYKNAVQVFIQSDTASWDAGDIRYNVLRWTSSPEPPFGGYGPSFVNPRTGEILGADIMLEWIFVTNRVKAEKYWDIQPASNHACLAAECLHAEQMFGQQMVKMQQENADVSELIRQSLHYLILHEMGHTFGLMHNMKASQLLSPEQLKTAKNIIIGSVMDYPAINLNGAQEKTMQFCQTEPGPYDLWAIEYGYSSALENEQAEAARLAKILSRSNEAQLAFGNDADDMRSSGKGIDPRINVNDLSNDAIAYSIDRMKLANSLTQKLMTKYGNTNNSYQEMVDAFGTFYSAYAGSAATISRYIGGIKVERTQPGSGTNPYTPISLTEQKRAMKALADYVFAPTNFVIPSDLLIHLQNQRRGFNLGSRNEDPKTHNRILMMQNNVLAHILSPEVLLRLTDSRAYGNEYSCGDMLGDLSKAIFDADIASTINSNRQMLQVLYVEKLIEIAGLKDKSIFGYDIISKERASSQLKDILSKCKSATAGDSDSKSHRNYLIQMIEKAYAK